MSDGKKLKQEMECICKDSRKELEAEVKKYHDAWLEAVEGAR